ncbi:hypothetical protein QEN19_001362 [Hanseniaspora menglaensis]
MAPFFSLSKNIAVLSGVSIELALDERLKYNVLLPISIAIIIIGMLKNFVMGLLGGDIKEQPRQKLTEWQTLQEINAFIANGKFLLDEKSFEMRRLHYLEVLRDRNFFAVTEKEESTEKSDDAAQDQLSNSLEELQKNSGGMKEMAIGNALNFIPQTVITWWLNHFFTNYVIMRLPFPLTLKFKEVVQNGIPTRDLDTSYTTTISWYFILMYGLDAFYNVFFYSKTLDIVELNTLKMQVDIDNQFNNLSDQQLAQQCDYLEKTLSEDIIYNYKDEFDSSLEEAVLNIYDKNVDIDF